MVSQLCLLHNKKFTMLFERASLSGRLPRLSKMKFNKQEMLSSRVVNLAHKNM